MILTWEKLVCNDRQQSKANISKAVTKKTVLTRQYIIQYYHNLTFAIWRTNTMMPSMKWTVFVPCKIQRVNATITLMTEAWASCKITHDWSLKQVLLLRIAYIKLNQSWNRRFSICHKGKNESDGSCEEGDNHQSTMNLRDSNQQEAKAVVATWLICKDWNQLAAWNYI